MNVRQLVAKLSSQGYKINYYIRPDGGIRITKIDGTSYPSSGGAGNQAARLLAGASLSVAQRSQRQEARQTIIETKAHKVTKYAPKLTKKEKKQLSHMNYISRKIGAWRIGRAEARKSKGREGSLKGVIEGWKASVYHHTGLAYEANIDAFLQALKRNDQFYETQEYLERAMDKLYPIIDAQLMKAHDIWYAWINEGQDPTTEADEDRKAVNALKKSWGIYKEVMKMGEGWKGYASKHKK